jgi:ribosomal protein S18 acetylase RimI-like enzyme
MAQRPGGRLPDEVHTGPASALEPDALAALFNEAYSDYSVPMHVDAHVLEFMQTAFDLVPERSRVAWRGERPVGFAMLGVRGGRGWVGGMGVVPEARRAGLGRRLMQELAAQAREAGVRELWLEVLETNTAARALYDALGYVPLRRLEVWTWDGPPATQANLALACSPRDARARIRKGRPAPEPWQRADETVDRLDVSTPALRAVTTAGGDAIYRAAEGRASVLQMHAGSETSAGVLLDTIRSREGVNVLRFLNVPADDLVTAALARRGARSELAQTEMRLPLA